MSIIESGHIRFLELHPVLQILVRHWRSQIICASPNLVCLLFLLLSRYFGLWGDRDHLKLKTLFVKKVRLDLIISWSPDA